MKPQLSVFNFTVKNQSETTVDIHVDGYIYDSPTKELIDEYWGSETSVSFKSFREQIPADIKTLNLYVNSGGGHVGDAMAIHDFLIDLENRGVTVNRVGRGIVASAATYLVMGKNSELTENSFFMIHEVSGVAYGNVSQVENQAKAMRKFNDKIVNFYSKATGLSETVISNMMNKESWLTAEEAKEQGFVQKVSGAANFSNAIKPEHWQFSNTDVLNFYNSFTHKNNVDMDVKKITEAITNGFSELLNKLNVKDKANDENVQNALSQFSTTITNAIQAENQSKESIQELVNSAVAEAVKNLKDAEPFKNAIDEATKNLITKESLDAAVKNVVTKDDLNTSIGNLTAEIAKTIGNKSNGGNPDGNEKPRRVKNRFSGKYEQYQ